MMKRTVTRQVGQATCSGHVETAHCIGADCAKAAGPETVKTSVLDFVTYLCAISVAASCHGYTSGATPPMRDSPRSGVIPCLESCGGDRSCKAQCGSPGASGHPPPGILYQR